MWWESCPIVDTWYRKNTDGTHTAILAWLPTEKPNYDQDKTWDHTLTDQLDWRNSLRARPEATE
jgi:hypothetical protein